MRAFSSAASVLATSFSRIVTELIISYRTLVANDEDALQNPYLIFGNMARVRRVMDRVEYDGPVVIAGDCTKVRPRLAYSNNFGSHVLGSTLPFDSCEIEEVDDIDHVIEQIKGKKAMASQVRAILVKVNIHLPID